jgi:NitT/TauT family transport system permease protein
LAIRAPLSARRATVAKFAAFLVPLGLWALVCFFWFPVVVITDPGDGQFKQGDFVEPEKIQAENAKLSAENAKLGEGQKEPTFTLTDQSMRALRSAGVPESVIKKVEDLKDFSFTRNELIANLSDNAGLDKDEVARFGESILDHAEKKAYQPKQLVVGQPSNPIWLPPPHKVAFAFYHAFVTGPQNEGDPWMHQSLWHSCKVIFWGFLLSAIVGVPLGILCGTFDLFSKLTEPFVDFIRYMPAPAFGVLVVAILGIYDGPKIGIIWIGTFFQMVLVVANTTRQFDESLLEAAQTLGATKRSLVSKVILPGILPNLYNDMRILLGWAWTYLIVAELVGATTGISAYIYQQGKLRHFEQVYAGIIMIGIVGLTCDQILAALARYLFPWMPKAEGAGAWAAFFNAITFLPRWMIGRVSGAGSAAAPASK